MRYLIAVELAGQIRSARPQYSDVTVVPVGVDEYAVMISRWYLKHDKYCCWEYDKYKRIAEAHGFIVDVPDNGMLIKAEEHTMLITDPADWAVVQGIITGRGPQDTNPRGHNGRYVA